MSKVMWNICTWSTVLMTVLFLCCLAMLTFRVTHAPLARLSLQDGSTQACFIKSY